MPPDNISRQAAGSKGRRARERTRRSAIVSPQYGSRIDSRRPGSRAREAGHCSTGDDRASDCSCFLRRSLKGSAICLRRCHEGARRHSRMYPPAAKSRVDGGRTARTSPRTRGDTGAADPGHLRIAGHQSPSACNITQRIAERVAPDTSVHPPMFFEDVGTAPPVRPRSTTRTPVNDPNTTTSDADLPCVMRLPSIRRTDRFAPPATPATRRRSARLRASCPIRLPA